MAGKSWRGTSVGGGGGSVTREGGLASLNVGKLGTSSEGPFALGTSAASPTLFSGGGAPCSTAGSGGLAVTFLEPFRTFLRRWLGFRFLGAAGSSFAGSTSA